jgi:hypothetical protein
MQSERVKVPVESHERRIQKAIDFQNKASQLQSNASVKIGDEKVQYFEKIALGSGATIAAIVSFMGANSSSVHTPRLVRWALLMLFLALFTAMLRNWVFPFYTLRVWLRHKEQADGMVDDLTALMFDDYPEITPIDEKNVRIPISDYLTDHKERAIQRNLRIASQSKWENWLFKLIVIIESASLAFVITAAILLVIAAWHTIG